MGVEGKQNGAEAKAAKRALRRAKKKDKKLQLKTQQVEIEKALEEKAENLKRAGETEFVSENVDEDDPLVDQYKSVLSKFQKPDIFLKRRDDDDEEEAKPKKQIQKDNDETDVFEPERTEKKALTRKEKRLRKRISIAALKAYVMRPDVVEIHDPNSPDPKLLVALKSYKNTVAVPRHWGEKRKFLQGKRGFEKPLFKLPAYIEETGISRLRNQTNEEGKVKMSKNNPRDRMNPKMGRMDIDYQVLHNAFFKFQTKPRMSLHGEMYHEGKEHMVSLRAKRPGDFSEELMRALGMKDGRSSAPPFLHNMQRFGPPPAYPKLKIPGVNCPIPPGCRYGYNEGEWGKPPVDEYGRPLYGDVFGQEKRDDGEDQLEKSWWGVVADSAPPQEGEEMEGEEDVEVPEGGAEAAEAAGAGAALAGGEEDMDEKPDDLEGIKSVSSVASGLETPEAIQLRKGKEKDGTGTETPDSVRDVRKPPKQLYQVLEEKKSTVGGSLFGTERTYVLPTAASAGASVPTTATSAAEAELEKKRAKASGQVNLALNPEELEGLDPAAIKKKYDAQVEAEKKAQKDLDASKRAGVDEALEEERQKKKRKSTSSSQSSGSKDKKKEKYKF